MAAQDPAAVRARADLQRVNRLMRSVAVLQRALRGIRPGATIAELGAGDGSLMLALAQTLRPARVVLVDRQDGIAAASCAALAALGCPAEAIHADALDWAREADPVDAIVCNLFLHHLQESDLARLFAICAARTALFVAAEPARHRLALAASHLVGLVGCNAVTRHDAVASVHAGFRAGELGALWPDVGRWHIEERAAAPVSHVFVSRRL
jgi:2-polyprenyl-3-methyl-5-hydroxy-6-metoxy-1,4-benzoquinol methylase